MFVRRKVESGEYDLSSHAHRERQEEQITTAEIEQALLTGDIIKSIQKMKEVRAV